MSAEENKAIFIHFVGELRKGNIGVIDEVCSPNFAFYSPNYPGWPRGLAGARQLVAMGNLAVHDMELVVEDIFAEGDKVAVRWTSRGTYNGEPRPGYPKPGERFTWGAISIYRFANGKIEEDWGVEAFSPTGVAWS
jgi:ketosteroid isomerase-like protein